MKNISLFVSFYFIAVSLAAPTTVTSQENSNVVVHKSNSLNARDTMDGTTGGVGSATNSPKGSAPGSAGPSNTGGAPQGTPRDIALAAFASMAKAAQETFKDGVAEFGKSYEDATINFAGLK